MPKLQYRFRVTFKQLGGQATADTVTHQVVSVTRPTLTHEEVTLDVYNSRIYLAGKHTWEPVTLVVRDDISNNVITLVDQQMQNQIDHHNQSAPIAGAQYKFSTVIDTLDGNNDEGSGQGYTFSGYEGIQIMEYHDGTILPSLNSNGRFIITEENSIIQNSIDKTGVLNNETELVKEDEHIFNTLN